MKKSSKNIARAIHQRELGGKKLPSGMVRSYHVYRTKKGISEAYKESKKEVPHANIKAYVKHHPKRPNETYEEYGKRVHHHANIRFEQNNEERYWTSTLQYIRMPSIR